MDFWIGVLAGILANVFTSIPIYIGVWVLWRRYYPILKLWGIPFFSTTSRPYNLVMSSRDDNQGRYRPSSGEMNAIIKLLMLFNDIWLRSLCRIGAGEPQLSVKVNSELWQDSHLILLGGPRYNQETAKHLSRLINHSLPFTFHEHKGEWILWNCAAERPVDSTEIVQDKISGNYEDYGLFIHAPHPKTGLTVNIFAGSREAGTLAAVEAAIKPHLCDRVIKQKKQQQVGDYFAVLIRVKVKDHISGEPEILDVRPITVAPSIQN